MQAVSCCLWKWKWAKDTQEAKIRTTFIFYVKVNLDAIVLDTQVMILILDIPT